MVSLPAVAIENAVRGHGEDSLSLALDFGEVVHAVHAEDPGGEAADQAVGVVLGHLGIGPGEEVFAAGLEVQGVEVIAGQEVQPAVQVIQDEGRGGQFRGPSLGAGQVAGGNGLVQAGQAQGGPVVVLGTGAGGEVAGPVSQSVQAAGEIAHQAGEFLGLTQGLGVGDAEVL